MDDIAKLNTGDLLAALGRGDITSVAVCERLLQVCAENTHLGAFHYLKPNEVLRAAAKADAKRITGVRAPLLGVPLAIKDNINSAGIPTTAGTPLFRDHRPTRNAPVLQRLVDAGAILLGKTAMHELAFGISGNNKDRGPARNPYDPERIPGGSSSGTAIAVATGMAPAGLGSDTGGSIRIPAALCGIVGLRPTTGRYPATGVVPISSTRDTVGPMARSVSDIALLDAVITREDNLVEAPPIDSVRLGVPDGFFFEELDSGLATLVSDAIQRLRDSGVSLINVPVKNMGALYRAASFPITLYETIPTMEAYLSENGMSYTFADVVEGAASEDVIEILVDLSGSDAITREAYLQAMNVGRPALQSIYGNLFSMYRLDGIVFPATTMPALPIGTDEIKVDGKMVSVFEIFIRNSGPGSVSGVPGIVLPCGRTSTGLPVGLSIDGPTFSDRHLLAVGGVIEEIVAG
jgi:Asp-tRNA(Asn)/Glu-tRNA(Gln) amidotransferase A subunit family amidase